MTVMAVDNNSRLSFENDSNGNVGSSYADSLSFDFTQLINSPEESVFTNFIFPNKSRRKDVESDDDQDLLPLDMRISYGSTDNILKNDSEQENYGYV